MTEQKAIEPNTPEWLEARRSGIGASDAAAAIGLSRWRTPADVCLDKWGESEPLEMTDAMRRGHLLEVPIGAHYAAETGAKCIRGNLVRSDDHPFMLCTPDMIIPDENKLVQIKTASTWNMDEWGPEGSDEIPEEYRIQLIHEMAVTKADSDDLAVLFADPSVFDIMVEIIDSGAPNAMIMIVRIIARLDFRIYTIYRDMDAEAALIEAEREFWENHVLAHSLPADYARAPDTGTIVDADGQELELVEKAREAYQARVKLDKALDAIKTDLQGVIGEDSGLFCGDFGTITWKRPKVKTVTDTDWKSIALELIEHNAIDQAEADEIIQAHTTTTETVPTRRFCWPRKWAKGGE